MAVWSLLGFEGGGQSVRLLSVVSAILCTVRFFFLNDFHRNLQEWITKLRSLKNGENKLNKTKKVQHL